MAAATSEPTSYARRIASSDTVHIVCLCRYLPVYVLPALLVHRGRLLNPATAGDIWYKVARGVARSSLFLAMYCTLAWRGVAGIEHSTAEQASCLSLTLPALMTLSHLCAVSSTAAAVHAGACAGHSLTGTSTGAVIAASCWTGGLATLCEKQSRRMELAFYCLSRVRALLQTMPSLCGARRHRARSTKPLRKDL